LNLVLSLFHHLLPGVDGYVLAIFFRVGYIDRSQRTSDPIGNAKKKYKGRGRCRADRIHLGVPRGHESQHGSPSAVTDRSVFRIQKKNKPVRLAQGQRPSGVQRASPRSRSPWRGACLGSSAPTRSLGFVRLAPGRRWSGVQRPISAQTALAQFKLVKKKSKKKNRKKGDVSAHAAPIYIYKKRKTNYIVRFASPSRCRVFPASYISAVTYFSLFSLP
jgi:hypothetical protein